MDLSLAVRPRKREDPERTFSRFFWKEAAQNP